jgi:hypothetical protein
MLSSVILGIENHQIFPYTIQKNASNERISANDSLI